MTNLGKHYNIGETHPCSKLTSGQVCRIRTLYVWRDAKFGAMALAKEFHVSHSHVCRIVRNEAWAV